MASTFEQHDECKAVQMIIHGRVQGVGFRHFARITALRIGVLGWVRNNYNGTVEIWAEGTQQDLNALISAIKRGPSRSDVANVETAWFTPKHTFDSFNIRS